MNETRFDRIRQQVIAADLDGHVVNRDRFNASDA